MELLDARWDGSAIVVSAVITDRVATGKCYLSVGSGDRVVTSEADAVADATVTYCASVSAAVDQPGVWSYRLEYRGNGTSGSIEGEVLVG